MEGQKEEQVSALPNKEEVTATAAPTSAAVKKKRKKRKKAKSNGEPAASGKQAGKQTNDQPPKQQTNSQSKGSKAYLAALEAHYPIKLQSSEQKGRYFVATRKITAGELVFKEKPYSLSPTDIDDYASSGCFHCLSEISAKDPSLKCPTCPLFYCSQQCKEASQPLHDLECPLFSQIKIFSAKSPVEGYKLLLVLRTLLQRQLELQSNKQHTAPLYDLILSLETHKKEHESTPTNAQHLEHLAEASTFILDLLKKDAKYKPLHKVPMQQLVDIFLIIKVNAIGLKGSNNPTGGGTGLGLFAGACLFNHSCVENVSHAYLTPENGGNNELVFYTVAETIQPGTEIAFSYLDDFYQPTQARQESLLKTKFFYCTCPRCVDPTEGGRLLRGAACTACKNQGSTKGGGKGKGSSASNTNSSNVGYLVPVPLPSTTIVDLLGRSDEEKLQLQESANWQCSKCKTVYSADDDKAKALYRIEKDAQGIVDQALCMLQLSQLMTPIVHDSGPEEFKKAISMLEEVLRNQSPAWHPNHYILFLCKLNLIGCYLQPGVNDLRRCLELSEQICQSAEEVFPTYSVTKAELLSDKANILQRMAASTKSGALQKRHAEKGKEVLQHAIRNLTVARGSQHHLTKEAQQTLQTYGRL